MAEDNENKWVGLSRSLWATIIPVASLIMQQTGVTNFDQYIELGNVIFSGVMVVVAGVLQFLSMRNPQPTTLAKTE